MFNTPCEIKPISPVLAKAMDRIFILHADHEQNASTSTVRLAGSSGANPFACIAAGIAALWGPAHGGANEAVLSMLDEIGDVSNIDKYIAKAKDKNDPFKLMGFGHRDLRPGADRRLDLPLERNALQPVQDRSPAPAVHRLRVA